MEKFIEKTEKHENTLTKILRKIIKQKDASIKQYKTENDELHQILQKQQSLLNKLNEENVKLGNQLLNSKSTSLHAIDKNNRSDKIKNEYVLFLIFSCYLFLRFKSFFLFVFQFIATKSKPKRATAHIATTQLANVE
jgi:hypothetical protein